MCVCVCVCVREREREREREVLLLVFVVVVSYTGLSIKSENENSPEDMQHRSQAPRSGSRHSTLAGKPGLGCVLGQAGALTMNRA